MIDFYTWTTPNGRKVSIMLQECGLPYREHAINIGKGMETIHANPKNSGEMTTIPFLPSGRTGLNPFFSRLKGQPQRNIFRGIFTLFRNYGRWERKSISGI